MIHRTLGWAVTVALCAVGLWCMFPGSASAQENRFEINANYSYMWSGSYNLYEGEIRMDDGATWGGTIDFAFRPDAKIELSYSYTSSHATFQEYYPGSAIGSALKNLDNPLSIQYFQIGSIYQLPKGKAQPFFGLLLGAVLFSPSGTAEGLTLESQWNFAVSLNAGVKVYMSEKFGLRFQGRLLLPMYFSGGSVYAGTGGAGVAVSAGVPVVQGDVGVGVFVCL
jgi:outer membrane protein W